MPKVASNQVKDEVFKLLQQLSDEDVLDILDYLNNRLDPDTLTEEELAEVEEARKEIARGDYVTLEQINARLRAESGEL